MIPWQRTRESLGNQMSDAYMSAEIHLFSSGRKACGNDNTCSEAPCHSRVHVAAAVMIYTGRCPDNHRIV